MKTVKEEAGAVAGQVTADRIEHEGIGIAPETPGHEELVDALWTDGTWLTGPGAADYRIVGKVPAAIRRMLAETVGEDAGTHGVLTSDGTEDGIQEVFLIGADLCETLKAEAMSVAIEAVTAHYEARHGAGDGHPAYAVWHAVQAAKRDTLIRERDSKGAYLRRELAEDARKAEDGGAGAGA